MDILIKSFDRPYYLDRCLKSIEMFVQGDYSIKILDDGTPPAYLEKILLKYPLVQIERSVLYQEKVTALQNHLNGIKPYPKFPIPSDSLVKAVSKCSEEFVLIEDDIWFTSPLHLQEVQEQMQKHKIVLVKLFWQGNQKFIKGKKIKLSPSVEELIPAIPFLSKVIFMNRYKADKILPVLYKTKISSVLYRMGILEDESEIKWPFYSIFSMAAAIYNKHYFMHNLQGAPSVFDEPYQLKRAVKWTEEHNGRFAKTNEQLVDTSYISSTYNGFDGINLDLIRLNYYLNEAWLKNEFDAMENFPKDFRPEYVKRFIGDEKDETTTYGEWLKWIQRFKAQYRGIGCTVE